MSEPIEFRIEARPNRTDRAFLVLKCAKSAGGECRFGLWQQPASGFTWQWDGKFEGSTIMPSVSCIPCGRHFNIINGQVHGA